MSAFSVDLTQFPLQDEPEVPKLNHDDIIDHLQTMKKQENSSVYTCRDYLNVHHLNHEMTMLRKSSSLSRNEQLNPINEICRTKMIHWCHEVANFCSYQRSTVAIGMSILDRYLSNTETSHHSRMSLFDRKKYQLASMTSLYIAVKMEETIVMDSQLLSNLSRGCHSVDDIEEMERDILQTLNWRVVSRPMPIDFIRHFLGLVFPSTTTTAEVVCRPVIVATLLDFARYQTELAVSEYKFMLMKPSVIALASILNAMEGIDDDYFEGLLLDVRNPKEEFCRVVMEVYGIIDVMELQKCRIGLTELFSRSWGYELREFVESQFCSNISDSFRSREGGIRCNSPISSCDFDLEETIEDKLNISSISTGRRRRSSTSIVCTMARTN